MVYITGTIYTARDAAHKRLVEITLTVAKRAFRLLGTDCLLRRSGSGQARWACGSVNSHTSRRMDAYTLR